MNPTNATCNGHARTSHGDNEPPQALNYKAHQHKVSGRPSAYEVPVPSAARGSMGCSSMDETLSDNEQIYKDPGHKREEIYASFEKSKSKIKGDSIKYVGRIPDG